jgi:putative ABC transport system permease protein
VIALTAWLADTGRDIHYAARTLARTPGFTAVAVTMLALGIGVNAAVFAVTDATLFKGFPLVQRNDRLLYMTTGRGCCVSYPDFEDWRAQARSFERMAIVHGVPLTLGDQNGLPELFAATEVSADTFTLVGQKPMLGRDFVPSDETPGAAPVAILRYSFWERRFGKDPAIIGQTIRLKGVPTTVVGVMPPGFSFPQNQELWVPLVPTPEVRRRENRDTWFAIGRLADGVTVEQARAEMDTIGRRLESAYPQTDKGFPPIVYAFDEFFIGSNATTIYQAMWGAVGFVLLIACANLANLLLTRAIGRSREVSVRMALGAGRWRIVRQLLVESLMLSSLGGLFGWWVAGWGVRLYALGASGAGISDQIAGTWFDHVLDYSMDGRVVAYLLAISIATGLLFGLAPASRLSKLDVNSALKDGGRGAAGGAHGRRLSSVLVVGEMALAVMLLAGAGTMIRSFLNVYAVNVGFKMENILAGLLVLPTAKYQGPDAQASFYDRLDARLQAVPGVESTAITDFLPLPGQRLPPASYELDGEPVTERDQRSQTTSRVVVSPAFFRTLGTTLLSGREFTAGDVASSIPVAIVNQQFVNRHWPSENPLGKRLRLFRGRTPQPWLTVVGVAPNLVQNGGGRQAFDPAVYVPYRQTASVGMWVIARTGVSPAGLAMAVRREVQALDAELPLSSGPAPLSARLAPIYQYRGLTAGLFFVFAALALLLASIGLYAVIAHSVSQRMQEIGIRTAMGATARDILALVFKQGMLPVGIGLAIGLVGLLGMSPILRFQLVQVSAADPITLAVASATLILSAALGCVLPARRAMQVDPVVALRHE